MTDINPINDLIGLTERLTAVMAKEVTLLDEQRQSEIGPLQAEKSALSSTYASVVNVVNGNGATIEAAAPDQRYALVAATARLKTTMAENVRAITVAKNFNERLVKALGAAAAEQRPSAGAYTSAGGTAPTVSASLPNSLTLDDRI
jgi:hypothetical protein